MTDDLLRGSEKVHQWRKEITSFFGTLCGLLDVKKDELSRFAYDSMVCSFSSNGLELGIWREGNGLGPVVKSDEGKLIFGLGKNLPLKYVQPLRLSLPIFLAKMIELFPRLRGQIGPLLKAGSRIQEI